MVGRNLLERGVFAAATVLAPGRAELDLLEKDLVREYVRRHRPDTVVHAAGRVGGIAANVADPAGFLQENLQMGMNLAGVAAEGGVTRFLNLSSSCVYPREAENPLREGALFSGPLEPTNEGYALAKLAVLRYGEFLSSQSSSFSWVSLIPCNLYGRWDSFEPERSHLVPAIIRKLHEARRDGRDVVEIWGTGEARREFMLAADLADLIGAALRDFDDLPPRVNLGLGVDHSVNEYYRLAAEVVGYKGSFVHDLEKPVGMIRKQVDTSFQAGREWPAATDLSTGLRITYDFFCEQAGA